MTSIEEARKHLEAIIDKAIADGTMHVNREKQLAASMSVWQPVIESRNLAALWVPWSQKQGPMAQQSFRAELEARLQQEFKKDPQQAQQLLTACAEHQPDLYTIATYNPPQDWPLQIVMCDQMQTLLDLIDYRKGELQTIWNPEELPGLAELIEQL